MVYRMERAMPEEALAQLERWLADRSQGIRTVAWLAEKTALSDQHIHECMRGTRAMTERVARLLGAETGIPWRELMPASFTSAAVAS